MRTYAFFAKADFGATSGENDDGIVLENVAPVERRGCYYSRITHVGIYRIRIRQEGHPPWAWGLECRICCYDCGNKSTAHWCPLLETTAATKAFAHWTCVWLLWDPKLTSTRTISSQGAPAAQVIQLQHVCRRHHEIYIHAAW